MHPQLKVLSQYLKQKVRGKLYTLICFLFLSFVSSSLAFSPSDMGTDIPGRSYKPYHTDNMEERKGHVKDMIHILNPHHPVSIW